MTITKRAVAVRLAVCALLAGACGNQGRNHTHAQARAADASTDAHVRLQVEPPRFLDEDEAADEDDEGFGEDDEAFDEDDDDEAFDEDSLAPARADRTAQLAAIHRAAGVDGPLPPILRSSEVYARAEDRDGRLVILVNEAFLAELDERAGTRWASAFVLAHELGHVVHRHAYRDGGAWAEELEADRFASRALRAMGATLMEAQAGLRAAPERASAAHPGTSTRLRAIARAWHH